VSSEEAMTMGWYRGDGFSASGKRQTTGCLVKAPAAGRAGDLLP
jgi:hypothetical protein